MTERIFESPGTSNMSTYIWQIALILLVAFLLGYVFRLLLNSKLKARVSELEIENQLLTSKLVPEISEADIEALNKKVREHKAEVERLNTKLSDCYATRIKAENSLSSLQTKYNELSLSNIAPKAPAEVPIPEVLTPVVMAASGTAGETTKKDDLKKIEGIGPKIEELLNTDGIMSYDQLIAANVDRIKGILIAAGPNYAVHDPSTWAEQAALANAGQWESLKHLQEDFKGGKRK
jgi:predicted flap endonuclease-1-like 5' DNA nuclease